ncbi:MAG: hypothetical protein HPAVJP_4780 [Candidatus Hepatoplasma vulgare]|nr:MAG: hypothetical protein HPAVJP_4780 [Candidatus Hepatoplasma sp.]
MVNKNKEISNKRIGFKLSDFFVEKLSLKNDTLFFGDNNYFLDVISTIGLNKHEAKRILNIKHQIEDLILNDNQIAELALHRNLNFEKVIDISEVNILERINQILKEKLQENKNVIIKQRNPIVTIMGHVDHGKTTLLDTIRKTNITSSEIGGITQKIGAYQAEFNSKKITFIDTPGHEAFTKMRANGAKVTDIAVIVVSADDSLMPQTKESIDHARAANIPIIIAINKIDKPDVNLKVVKDELIKYGLILEEWGGDIKVVEISALKNKNIDKLLQAIIDVSETLDLKVPFNTLASGTVIESNISKNRGNLVDIIVLSGELHIGDSILIDGKIVKIKSLSNEKGEQVKFADPSVPVEIYGIGFSPEVGSNFVVVEDKGAEKIANLIFLSKKDNIRFSEDNNKNDIDPFLLFKDKIFATKKIMNIILKANSLGMLEALSDKIDSFGNENVEIKIIRKDVGEITFTDLLLAEASDAYIYQFNLPISEKIRFSIKEKNISVLSFDIIYKLLEHIEEKTQDFIPPKIVETEVGEIEVIKVFNISKIGVIAGGVVRKGVVNNNSFIKILRDDKVIHEQKIDSLKVQKDNVKIVKQGNECGVFLKNYSDIKEGDIFKIIEKKEVKQ